MEPKNLARKKKRQMKKIAGRPNSSTRLRFRLRLLFYLWSSSSSIDRSSTRRRLLTLSLSRSRADDGDGPRCRSGFFVDFVVFFFVLHRSLSDNGPILCSVLLPIAIDAAMELLNLPNNLRNICVSSSSNGSPPSVPQSGGPVVIELPLNKIRRPLMRTRGGQGQSPFFCGSELKHIG